MTLPNGIVTGYSYDTASQVTGIRYQVAGNTLGNLSYAYGLDGRRTQVAGSFARTGIPLPVSTTAYNAANELTTWGTANLFYDASGNMTSDGTNSFVWNARNQLASMNGATITFQYAQFASRMGLRDDPFGRRVSKTISGATTSFLYDGVNPVQELSGATPTANLLIGLSIDEHFTRTDSAGARNFLTDPLGSTVALTDPTGTLQTQYTYEPFGSTTVAGQASANLYQYTGRENDGTGLYFYRARYYSPMFGRFVSSDPIGFAGGINLYAYASNAPTIFVDPLGLDKKDRPNPCGHSGFGGGIGVSYGGNFDLGVGIAGATGTASAGAGAFYDSQAGPSAGAFATGGAAAYAANYSAGAPTQPPGQPLNWGAFVGGGPAAFLTNARSVQQLSGPFTTNTLSVGVGPVKASAQLAYANGTYVLSAGPPLPYVSGGLGLSFSRFTTSTKTTHTGCH